MAEWARRFGPLAIVLWHVLLALALAYAFMIVLMTASSQAGVAERLGRLDPPADYGAAFPRWRKHQEIESAIKRGEHFVVVLDSRIANADRSHKQASAESLNKLAGLLALHPRLKVYPQCDFFPGTGPLDVAKASVTLKTCLGEVDLPPSLRKEAEQVVGQSPTLVDNATKWHGLKEDFDALTAERRRVVTRILSLKAQEAELQAVNDSFAELSVLQRSWMMGGFLTEFPPSMIQILLAFVSGLFGSLLLTLVLIVYPKSDMTLGATDQGYGPRILLGGLISLCVFVILGGGTAVLGTNNGFAEGEANFLAFCAVGILAGMFSDRVAAWLSDRADAFFKRNPQPPGPGPAANAEQAEQLEQGEQATSLPPRPAP